MLKGHKIYLTFILVAGLGCVVGWFGGRMFQSAANASCSKPLREIGYSLINPLLTCTQDQVSDIDKTVQDSIQNTINQEVAKGDITTASVYYRLFGGGSWALVNGSEEYYPASLNKIPLMIAYFNSIEGADFLSTKSIYFPTGLTDQNTQQEIAPEHPITPGQSYTEEELVNAMIRDSDNNATLLLLDALDQNTLAKVFSDLNVPFLAPGESPKNYMNVSDFAFFFRVLYNGTYLSHADSENALTILSQTTFNDGLVAGVPSGTKVAHKFGLVSIAPDNVTVTSRELHDCGIVYPAQKDPYLLCVMTKSTGTLQGAEHAIATISQTAYQNATK